MTLSAPPASPTSAAVQPDVRRAALATLVGAVVTFGLLAVWVLATASGQRLDDDAMRTVVAGRETQLTVLSMLGYVSIGTVGVVTGACVGLALARGRARLALAAVAVVGGANVTTQVLKHGLLDRVALADGVVQLGAQGRHPQDDGGGGLAHARQPTGAAVGASAAGVSGRSATACARGARRWSRRCTRPRSRPRRPRAG